MRRKGEGEGKRGGNREGMNIRKEEMEDEGGREGGGRSEIKEYKRCDIS